MPQQYRRSALYTLLNFCPVQTHIHLVLFLSPSIPFFSYFFHSFSVHLKRSLILFFYPHQCVLLLSNLAVIVLPFQSHLLWKYLSLLLFKMQLNVFPIYLLLQLNNYPSKMSRRKEWFLLPMNRRLSQLRQMVHKKRPPIHIEEEENETRENPSQYFTFYDNRESRNKFDSLSNDQAQHPSPKADYTWKAEKARRCNKQAKSQNKKEQ